MSYQTEQQFLRTACVLFLVGGLVSLHWDYVIALIFLLISSSALSHLRHSEAEEAREGDENKPKPMEFVE